MGETLARLRSPESKSEFKFHVDGYQLFKPVGEDFDDNWLILKMAVDTPERRWNGRGPYLLTFELNHLIDRMKTWAADGGVEELLTFTASNVAFGKGPSGPDLIQLRVGFDLDSNPDLHRQAGIPLWVRFEVTPAELLEFAGDLEKEASPFPERHLTGSKKLFKKKL